jgi:predicted dehydrogenase
MPDRRKSVSVVGGGRWAATIASIVCRELPHTHAVTMHSPHNAAGLAEWQAQHPAASVQDRLPDYANAKPHAVIVANAAASHAAAAAQALSAGVPTLVEKPIALSADEARRLAATAASKATVLAASNVFLFARYLETFTNRAKPAKGLKRLRFVWADPAAEVRWGMRKRYDPALTVTDDILPHIVAILTHRLGLPTPSLDRVSVARGGAEVTLGVRWGTALGEIVIARESDRRRRLIEVETTAGPASVDFAEEPAKLNVGGLKVEGDPIGVGKPSPLTAMVLSFLQAADGAPLDARLAASHAVEALHLADDVRPLYLAEQQRWLRGAPAQDAGREYAERELAARASAGL